MPLKPAPKIEQMIGKPSNRLDGRTAKPSQNPQCHDPSSAYPVMPSCSLTALPLTNEVLCIAIGSDSDLVESDG
jgi:hypothetical protein